MRRIKSKMGKYSVIVFFLLLTVNGFAQNQEKLEQLAVEFNDIYKKDSVAVAQYLALNGGERRFMNSQGQLVELVKIVDGRPIFIKEFNSGAALTTNTHKLYEGGGLGLSLDGTGLTVGVWDGGQAGSHVEFDTRVSSGDGSGSFSDHATHVMGTILAKGLNATAKGMANNAFGKSYLWDNDLAEMTNFAWAGGLVSNHSYGTVTGWNNGVWNGNPAISEDEDYKFGFYGLDAPGIDNIARNAPYYLMVKSAGNDRNDSGPGHPADGNMGTGFDSIGPAACAKNNLTVGAAFKLFDYTGPQDVEISSFSSWGPTDDGRIKPDIVGAGVGLLSTSAAGEESYTTKSGTSMSSPNVTGSLLLLQEHFSNLNAGAFMRSSTLKGLVIHTAKEAGQNDGPDYSYGWGLLDAAAAATHISNVDQENFILSEEQLVEGQEFMMDIYPQKDTKVTATICWIDPAAPASAVVLDSEELRLVNDLDIRIVDDAGHEFQPWILNPARPFEAASKGDNFRDNVEQIQFVVPVKRKYTVKVTHKNTLQEGMQEFSLILTQNSIDDGLTAYYYIGEDGNWNDPNNWSLTSGGTPAGTLPDASSNIVIDENSFQSSNTLTMPADVAVNSLSWFAAEGNSLDLGQNTLSIAGDIILAEKLTNPIHNGAVMLNSADGATRSFYTANTVFDGLDLVVNSSTGQVDIYDSLMVHSLIFQQGSVDFTGINLLTPHHYLGVNTLDLNGTANSTIDLTGLIIDVKESFAINSDMTVLTDDLTWIHFNQDAPSTLSSVSALALQGTISVYGGFLSITGDVSLGLLEVIGAQVDLQNGITLDNLGIVDQGLLNITAGETLTVNKYISLSAQEGMSGIRSSTAEKAFLHLNLRTKYCFAGVEISNVDLLGEAVVSVGTASAITNSANWQEVGCGDIIFAEFEYDYNCAGGVTKFTDMSTGDVENRTWEVYDGDAVIQTTTDSIFYFSFAEVGEYQVRFSVSNAQQDNDVMKAINIIENHLEANEIVDNETSMASRKSSDIYQWFGNNLPIEGASERVYNIPKENFGQVVYFVVTSDEICNMKSNDVIKIVTDIDDLRAFDKDISIYPNPSNGTLGISFGEPGEQYELTITGVGGRTFFTDVVRSSNEPTTVDLQRLNEGIYILSLSNGDRQIQRRIVIEK
jgi:hypothetical protein